MKKILLLSLILSLVYLGCGKQPTNDPPNDPPLPGDDSPVVTENTDTDTPVNQENLNLGQLDPAERSTCEITTKQRAADDEELVQIYETAGCKMTSDEDENNRCLNHYNYPNCYKPNAPSPSNSLDITCTRAGSNEELSFTSNTYNLYPGEGLLCDITNNNKNGEMLFYSINVRNCQSRWETFKAQQGYTCSDDPPSTEEEQAEESTTEEESPDTGSAEPVSETYYTITNQTSGATVLVSLNDETINLAEDDCVQVSGNDFGQLSITTDANKDVCAAGECGEAGHYTVERRTVWLFQTVYRLEESSANSTCSNTL